MNPIKLTALAACCLLLNGCVVAAAADLAATTVLTVGKVAVKGTGAVVRAAIPDGDSDEEKAQKEKKKQQQELEKAGYRAEDYQRVE
ncbi:hypothetical protein BWD09_09065 [Neisseria dentiae]|uniref:Stress responsive alpha-beta barrel n=1 Tax=Neisseria dentiae TaxID=194197 RepID=A0A1X3D6P1_9NEIS|nr:MULTISPECIES: NF038104 family lipoprotein [Neisseria]MDO4226704.1 NF038104 family lipoprotein [Neisseria sp.]OSI15197.1 hypothetical protein BWD09_09065 [Neisseria dentiae]QMT45795.1 NF038104 family lipoprotein [Neisseria dentiae]STZ51775.1 Uncharacterised protein [Neisseria dentiae]